MNPDRRDAPPDGRPIGPRTLTRVLLTVAFIVLGVVLAARFAGAVAAPLVFILLAAILAIGLNPLVIRLERLLHVPRAFAAGIVMAGLLGFLGLFTWLVVPPLVWQAFLLAKRLPDMLGSVQENVVAWARAYPMLAPLVEGRSFADPSSILQQGSNTVTSLISIGALLANFAFSAALLLALVFFLLMSPEPMLKGFLAAFPSAARRVAERTLVRIGQQLGGWLVGAITISSIDGALTALGLWIVGFDSALLFGLIVAITNVIPVIGPLIGLAPPVFVAVANGSWQLAVYAALVSVIVQNLEAYLVAPFVYRRNVQLQPASLVIGVLVFGALLGLVGVFLTVPLLIIVKALYEEIYLDRLQAPAPEDSSITEVIQAAGSKVGVENGAAVDADAPAAVLADGPDLTGDARTVPPRGTA